MPPRILVIAGSDSSGGAGIQVDIKTITMLGGYAMTAITAVTAQNTLGVQAARGLPGDFVLDQMASCIEDIGVDVVKTGMLGSEDVVRHVAGGLLAARGQTGALPLVVDPVMVATSGSLLADPQTIAAMRARLFPLATLVTPNLPELEALGGVETILAHTPAVLIKGGHADGDTVIDRLVTREGEVARWQDSRIDTRHTHGTGCTLASAIAVGLGQGLGLAPAIEQARAFVRAALLAAPGFGKGSGPLGHHAALTRD